ncbi:origin recognition complex subunit 2-like [Sinocyclocheilus rhinocerous]|uniref:origin recognition complex subunit 2-like n=1 Tax=Sinocyclocheilus rhinocerous TaxID=307959 RepID=UPI0007BA6E82|nr:PREDICTED: origin recognition complex subunit 2-like [Sinocyclocheilus rhinocerous]
MTQKQPLEARFVADEDVLDHIVEKQKEIKAANGSVQTLVTLKTPQKSKRSETEEDDDDEDVINEQNYVDALCTGSQDESEKATVTAGSSVFSFQTIKRGNKMAQMASEWARAPGKSVTFCTSDTNEESSSPTRAAKKSANQNKTPQKGKKVQFISTTPHRLRKRLSAPNLRSDSESDFSPSNSEDDDDAEEHEGKRDVQTKTPSKNTSAAALYKTPSKKGKKAAESDLVEEYFEAHISSKVLTSDRTLQKLQTPKLDRETLLSLLGKNPPCFAEEIKQLNAKHEKNFNQWKLQLHMGFNILIYGLGSKKLLLEKFRTSMLSDYDHVVVNGFFPSMTLKSVRESSDYWQSFSWRTRTILRTPVKHPPLTLSALTRKLLLILQWVVVVCSGLSFQDFYQRCRESFLVNSDITLRTQLTEFRDHKLIRTKKGADGVEYLLIPVDNGTLTDFLEKNEVE